MSLSNSSSCLFFSLCFVNSDFIILKDKTREIKPVVLKFHLFLFSAFLKIFDTLHYLSELNQKHYHEIADSVMIVVGDYEKEIEQNHSDCRNSAKIEY